MYCYSFINLYSMKNYSIILLAAAGLLVQSCGNNNKPKADPKEAADASNKTYDSLHAKAYPTNGRTVSGPDAKFAVAAANGGMTEVELGRLAQQKGVSQQVKDFGKMMVDDHSQANAELKTIAAHHYVQLPDSVGGDEKQLIAELSAKSGSDFDIAYVDAMVKDHEEDVKEFTDAQKILTYDDLNAFDKKTLPVLQKHLDAIKKIKAQMK